MSQDGSADFVEKVDDPSMADIFAAEESTDKEFEKQFALQSKARMDTEIAESERELTLFEKKMKRMFGGANDVKKLFTAGFMTGSMVGCTFGGVLGAFYAIQTRSFMTFPLVAITTGASFGFFMGIGAIFRSGYCDAGDAGLYELKTIEDGSIVAKRVF